MAEPSQTARAETGPLLEIAIEPGGFPKGPPTDIRVDAQGRYEIRSEVVTEVEGGRVSTKVVPRKWRLQWTYTPEELDELRKAIAEATDPPLRERYGRPIPDSGRAVWRLRADDRVVEVTVDGYPTTKVPALERLNRRLFEIRRTPAETSVWRVRAGGGVVERRVDCPVGGAKELQPMLAALFPPEPGHGSPPEKGEPLVAITWKLDGKVTERTLVYGNGARIMERAGKRTPQAPLTPEQVAALREAIVDTNWPELPDPICG